MTSVTGRRIGLLGGTFDPPHLGHLRAAVVVRHTLDLDAVLLVPNGDPWQKRDHRTITRAPVRLEMVEAAAATLRSGAGVVVSDVEVRRSGPSFTVDTVSALREAEPDIDVTVVIGRDVASQIPTWERYEELLTQVGVAVVARPEIDVGPPAELLTQVVEVPMEQLDVSSSGVRALVAQGRPVDVLVPAEVAAIIVREGLYRVGD